MSVVPVLVRHCYATNILTYALLDNCSQGTFIDKDLLGDLDVESVSTEL